MPSLGVSLKRLLALSRASREARTPSAPSVIHAAAILGVSSNAWPSPQRNCGPSLMCDLSVATHWRHEPRRHFSEFSLAPPHCTVLAAAGDLAWSQRANVPSAPDHRRERAQINIENVVKSSIGNFVESSVRWRCASVRFHEQHSFRVQNSSEIASQNREQSFASYSAVWECSLHFAIGVHLVSYAMCPIW